MLLFAQHVLDTSHLEKYFLGQCRFIWEQIARGHRGMVVFPRIGRGGCQQQGLEQEIRSQQNGEAGLHRDLGKKGKGSECWFSKWGLIL